MRYYCLILRDIIFQFIPGKATRLFIVTQIICSIGKIINAQDPLVICRLESEVIFDAMPDEEAWNNITPLHLTTFQPVTGREPSEKTVIFLGYSDDHLWIAGRLYDSEPSLNSIQSTAPG